MPAKAKTASSERVIKTSVSKRGVGTITIDRPAVNNAYNRDMLLQAIEAVTKMAHDSKVRVIVIRGNGPHFQAGADLKWIRGNIELSAEENFLISMDTTNAIRGLNEVQIDSEQDALNYLYSGELARTTSQHKLNKRSNRSHSIFTIFLQQRARSGVSERIVCSKLNLVDLAGSERLKKTMDDADDLVKIDATTKKESMYINQSLTYLEQCVVALSKKNPGHVPYRQTRLTNVLKDAIGGNCNTLMFANIYGEVRTFGGVS